MAALLDKKCPECGGRIAFRQFMNSKSQAFACAQCGVHLGGDLKRQLIGIVTGGLFISLPMTQAIHDPRWWWGLILGAALYFLWSCLFLSLRVVPGPGPAREARTP